MASQRQQATRPVVTVPSNTAPCPPPKQISRQSSLASNKDAAEPEDSEAVLRPDDKQEKAELKRDEARRSAFQEECNKELEVPSGYRKVEVLIIRWDERIDDFKGHSQEIKKLKAIFEEYYGYGCSVVEINAARNPQTELDWQILNHVREHDAEDSLLIVYYTGHGNQVFEEDSKQRLELAATLNLETKEGLPMPAAFWDIAEGPLRTHARGDVLAILDCCHASIAAIKGRTPENRTYQLLAATSVDESTTGPGPTSFTTALCESLQELLQESNGKNFPVLKLHERINERRKSHQAFLHDRLHRSNERSVMLGRLDLNPEREASFFKIEQEKASLVLRFSLEEAELKEDQIRSLAKALPKACHGAGVRVRKIDWVKMRERDSNRVTKNLKKVRLASRALAAFRSASSPAVLQDPHGYLAGDVHASPTQLYPIQESNKSQYQSKQTEDGPLASTGCTCGRGLQWMREMTASPTQALEHTIEAILRTRSLINQGNSQHNNAANVQGRRRLSTTSVHIPERLESARKRSRSRRALQKRVSIQSSEAIVKRQQEEHLTAMPLLVVAFIVVPVLFIAPFSFEERLLTGLLVTVMLASKRRTDVGDHGKERSPSQKISQERNAPEIVHQASTWPG